MTANKIGINRAYIIPSTLKYFRVLDVIRPKDWNPLLNP